MGLWTPPRNETDKAYLLDTGDNEDIWIPKSVAEIEHMPNKKTVIVTVPMNWAVDKGIV